MMNLFRRKSETPEPVEDLTLLDSPTLLNVPFINVNPKNNSHNSFVHGLKQMSYENNHGSKTDSFANKRLDIVKAGIKGEQERNAMLEQQVQMLTIEATRAIDQLNELHEQNEMLKKENEALKKQRFSMSTINSLFSSHNKSNKKNSMSTSSESTIDSTTDFSFMMSHHRNNSSGSVIEPLETKKDAEIQQLKLQISEMEKELQQLSKSENSLKYKLNKLRAQNHTEKEFLNNRIKQLVQQLQEKNQKSLQLMDRIQDFNSNFYQIKESRSMVNL